MSKRKWTTIVGANAPTPPILGPDRVEVRYVLDTVVNATDAGPVANPKQRARLLYEKGEGPQAPDTKPEPSPRPRDRTGHRGAGRPPKAWTGWTDPVGQPK